MSRLSLEHEICKIPLLPSPEVVLLVFCYTPALLVPDITRANLSSPTLVAVALSATHVGDGTSKMNIMGTGGCSRLFADHSTSPIITCVGVL